MIARGLRGSEGGKEEKGVRLCRDVELVLWDSGSCLLGHVSCGEDCFDYLKQGKCKGLRIAMVRRVGAFHALHF